MFRFRLSVIVAGLCLFLTLGANAQTQRTPRILADGAATGAQPVEPDSPAASSTVSSGTQAIVPRLMKFSGALHDAAGKPVTGTVDVTFSLYSTEAGGEPLWFETQSVQADDLGRYTALLGAMHTDGLPVDLFTSGEVRWMGIQVGAEAEQQPRVLLVSVPYALKAGDAETLGGKPASAYVLADAQSGTAAGTTATSIAAAALAGSKATTENGRQSNVSPLVAVCSTITSNLGGTANSLPMFTAQCNVENSMITQSGSNVGIGTASPGAQLDVQNPTTQNNIAIRATNANGTMMLIPNLSTSAYNGLVQSGDQGIIFYGTAPNAGNLVIGPWSGIGTPGIRMTAAGKIGIGTAIPGARLDVQNAAAQNDIALRTTNANGTIMFIPNLGYYAYNRLVQGGDQGIIFYGTAPNAGNLVIGPWSGIGSPGIRMTSAGNVGIGTAAPAATLDVAGNINASSDFTSGGDATVTGSVTAASFSGDGSNLTNLPSATGLNCGGCIQNFQLGVNYAASSSKGGDANNALNLGGVAAINFPLVTASNTFMATQNVATTSGAALMVTTNDATTGAAVFSNANTSGDAITITDPGTPIMHITATGNLMTVGTLQALNFNTSSNNNTLVGASAGNSLMTGANNVATGSQALGQDSTGIANTAVGALTLYNNSTASQNTAVGYGALLANCFGVSGTCSGSNNTAVGFWAGYTSNTNNANVTGANNTYIGYLSGPGTSTQLSNATAIGANAAVGQSNTLVLGSINGVNGATSSVSVGIGTQTPAVTLQVVGDIRVGTSGTNGCVQNFAGSPLSGSCSSDERLKTDIQPFSPLLDKVAQLQPVHYHWRVSEHPEYHFGTALISGLVAQDVEKLFPELVAEDSRGFKTVNYSELPFLLLQSVRELKAENDELREQIKAQSGRTRLQKDDEAVAQLRREVEELRALVTKSAAAGQLTAGGTK